MFGAAARDGHVAARDRAAEQQRAGHDAIGNDLVFDAVQFAGRRRSTSVSVPHDRKSSRPSRSRSSRGRRLRVPSRVLDDVVVPSASTAASIAFLVAPTLGMRNSIVAPCKRLRLRLGDQIAVRVAHLAAKRDEGLLVHVGRARAEHAAAGKRNFGSAEAPEQRADDIERGRELAHQRVGRAIRRDVACVDRNGVVAFVANARAKRFEQRPHHRNVGDARHAMQRDFTLAQQWRQP